MAPKASKGSIRRKTKYVLSATTATLIVNLLGSADMVYGQGTTLWNPVKTTCNLRLGRGVVLGNKMYVDGGEQMDQQNYLNGIDNPYPDSIGNRASVFRWQNKHLWELDLSKSFNVSKPPWTAKTKPEDWNEHYNGAQGTLWDLGDGKFYTVGGWMSNIYEGPPGGHRIGAPYYTTTKASDGSMSYHYQLPPTRIHAYDPIADGWSHINVSSEIHRLSDIGFAVSKRNKVGFTLGGFPVVEKQEGTDANFIANIVDVVWQSTFSMYDFKKNQFNTTDLSDEIEPLKEVVLHSLDRVGDEGVLIALSGLTKKNGVADIMRPMDVMLLYDIASAQWMTQKATGDIPPVRTRSCQVLVPAPDLSSYQLYMFSGITTGSVRILDMYVLSIPAFIWTKIDLVNYPNKWGIAETACGLYEERQIIIVPGEVNVSTSNNTWLHKCNMGTGVHVFDIYDWTFKAEFDPNNKGNKVPVGIVNLIGGDEKGNAKLQQPKAGWDNKKLGPIFQTRNQLLPNDDSTTPNSTTTSKDSPPRQTGGPDGNTGNSKSNTGAIAGGVVGGIFGFALLVGLFLWWRRRRAAAFSTAPVELGSNGLHEAPPYYDASYSASMPPQELQAYEPPEMGGTGYYAPAKAEGEPGQEHHQEANTNNPPPSSVYPVSPESQRLEVSSSFTSPVSPAQSPIPSVRTGLISRKAVGS